LTKLNQGSIKSKDTNLQILNAPIESNCLLELTYLNGNVSASATPLDIAVDNGQGLATNDYIIFERRGTEKAELKKITKVGSSSISSSSSSSSFSSSSSSFSSSSSSSSSSSFSSSSSSSSSALSYSSSSSSSSSFSSSSSSSSSKSSSSSSSYSSGAGNVITVPTLSFDHKDGIQVQKILYNQRKFYSCATEAGNYTLISGGTKDIEVDRPDGTFFEHADGTSSTWYKATYCNETTKEETDTADAIATQGSESNHYTSLYAIRRQSGFEEAFGISNETVADYRDEAENEFESRIATTYSTPLSQKPKVGRQIVNLLAAGNLLIKEYGMEADIEISKSGARMLERANELLGKIVDGTLKLIDEDGSLIGTQDTMNVSGSNTYDPSKYDKGSLFSLEDEKFRAANPETGAGATH